MSKVDEEFKREISMIIDQELKNPNITGLISVTKVKTSSDLKMARVYLSMINSKSKKYIPSYQKCIRLYKDRTCKKGQFKIHS